MNDQRKSLVIDDSVRAPAPLDPALASVSIHSKSNEFGETFPVSASAFFGSEIVLLEGEGFSVEVLVSLEKSLVDLEFLNCRGRLAPKKDLDNTSGEWLVEEHEGDDHRRQSFIEQAVGGSAEGSERVSANLTVSGRMWASRTASNEYRTSFSRLRKNWEAINNNTVILGTSGRTLDGKELDDFEGWIVRPKSMDQRCAIKASLSTRLEWMNFDDILKESFAGRLGQSALQLFRSENDYRKRMFELLLRDLATRGLQANSESKEATLCVDILVFSPDSEVSYNATHADRTRRIPLSTEPLERFLSSDDGQEVEALVVLGVPVEFVRSQQDLQQPQEESKRGVFTAQSSPYKAMDAYKTILGNPGVPRTAVQKKFSGRVLPDLGNLGLIETKKGLLYPTSSVVADAEQQFRFAVSRAPTICSTRTMLIDDPEIDPVTLMDAISVKFGKSYSTDGSKLRVGNALKRWTRWLEPHLIDPEGGSLSESLREGAVNDVRRPGRATLATPARIQEIQKQMKTGKPLRQIAIDMGLIPRTVYLWKHKGLLDNDPKA